MRVSFFILAVFAISAVNAATNSAPTSLSTPTSTILGNPFDTALGDATNKRFLRSERELKDEVIDDEEERTLANKLSNLLGFNNNAKRKVGALSTEQVKTASKKLKVTPEQLQSFSRKRKAAAEQVAAAAKRQNTVFNIPEHLRITPEQLMGLREGRTRDVFAKWAKYKVLPEDIKPMLQGLTKSDRKQVFDWYKNDIYRFGHWNVR